MNYKEAQQIAEDILKSEFKNDYFKVMIDTQHSLAFARGWYFRYNTVEFVENNDTDKCLLQISPIVIDKIDGSVYRLKSRVDMIFTAEFYLNNFIECKERNIDSKYFELQK